MASMFAQVGLTMTALLGLGVIWRWFVFHSRRVRQLDKSISVLRLGEDEEPLASIPAAMTVYPWMLGAAAATLGIALLLIHKDMGTVVLGASILGGIVALVWSLDEWQHRQDDAAAGNLVARETEQGKDGEESEALAN